MVAKVDGDGEVTNETEKGDGDEEEVEGEEKEAEGNNEGDEKEETAEEEAGDETLADEGDIGVELVIVSHNQAVFPKGRLIKLSLKDLFKTILLKPFAFQETMMTTTTMTMKCNPCVMSKKDLSHVSYVPLKLNSKFLYV